MCFCSKTVHVAMNEVWNQKHEKNSRLLVVSVVLALLKPFSIK